MSKPLTPLLAVDIIIELGDAILLIERKFPPPGWALPGGFVDIGETLEHAAVREAREETSLDITLECLLGCYSSPTRDARGHTVSAVYIAHANGTPAAADDAKAFALVDPHAPQHQLAFDHGQIIKDYCHYRDTGSLPALRI
jgi:8-oxo-dGTP diphosphatase